MTKTKKRFVIEVDPRYQVTRYVVVDTKDGSVYGMYYLKRIAVGIAQRLEERAQ